MKMFSPDRRCATIGLYGLPSTDIPFEEFYEATLRWFSNIGIVPNELSFRACDARKSSIFKKYKTAEAKLRKREFRDINSIYIEHSEQFDDKTTPFWTTLAACTSGKYSSVTISIMGSDYRVTDEPLQEFVAELVRMLQPEYGIGFYRQRWMGPEYYVGGILFGGFTVPTTLREDDETELAIGRWGDMAMNLHVWREGVIRDVYPQNYLMEPVLSRTVKDQSLREWIEADAVRGSLKQLDDRMTLWSIGEERIDAVRKVLWDAEIIFNWRAFVDREEPKDPYVAAVSLLAFIPCRQCEQVLDVDSIAVPNGQDRVPFLVEAIKKLGWTITFAPGINANCPTCSQKS
ncbi:MAG: hypothetical protein R3C01_09655 [Planctomycetaceae bacterium]